MMVILVRQTGFGCVIMLDWYFNKFWLSQVVQFSLRWLFYVILKFKFSQIVQLITNPDMLHMSILPFHGQFSRILSNLR